MTTTSLSISATLAGRALATLARLGDGAVLRRFLAGLLLVLAASSNALATSAISFEGEDYLLDFTVGDGSWPSLVALTFSPPESDRRIAIPIQLVSIKIFDVYKRAIFLHFRNPGDPALPKDFSLSVNNDLGVLRIDGKSIPGHFFWDL